MKAPAPRLVWLGAAAILVVAALVALTAIVQGDFSETDGRILGSLAVVLYAGGALFAGLSTVERGRPTIGWPVVIASPICFALMLIAIWNIFDEQDHRFIWRAGWSATIVLLVGIMLTTAILLADGRAARRLAFVAGVLAGIAAALSIAAIWAGEGGDDWIKLIAVLWVLAVLSYVLVPVVDRFARADGAGTDERVLATLGDVELVATTAPSPTEIQPELERGERLILRYRPGHS